MSAEAKGGNQITLDLETNVLTSEGRHFADTLKTITIVHALHKNEVTFEGREIARVQFVGNNRAVTLYECPRGYYVFFDKLVGKNNEAFAAESLEGVLAGIGDGETRQALQSVLQPADSEQEKVKNS
jgi:hypothetical protein